MAKGLRERLSSSASRAVPGRQATFGAFGLENAPVKSCFSKIYEIHQRIKPSVLMEKIAKLR